METPQISAYFDMLNRSRKLYGRMLEPVCRKWDLTQNELDVLLFLHNNPGFDRAADIVTHRGMAKSHVSLSVTELVDRGLLERQFSSADRRTAHLRLTQNGTDIAAEAREAQKKFFSLLYTGITEEEFAIWQSITRRIQANITAFDSL